MPTAARNADRYDYRGFDVQVNRILRETLRRLKVNGVIFRAIKVYLLNGVGTSGNTGFLPSSPGPFPQGEGVTRSNCLVRTFLCGGICETASIALTSHAALLPIRAIA